MNLNKKNPLLIKLNRPHQFEGETYSEIDLSGLEELTTVDLLDADKQFAASESFSFMNEMSLGYLIIVASKATKKPVEFFEQMAASNVLKVKNCVMTFLNA